MTDSSDRKTADSQQRAERIRQVVNDCIVRRAAGEQITDQSLLDAHSDLSPELAAELRNLHMIEEAERGVANEPTAAAAGLHIVMGV